MSEILVSFTKPTRFNLVGQLILARTGDQYHHSFITVDGVTYNPTFPRTLRMTAEQSPVPAITYAIPCDGEAKAIIKRYLEDQVGAGYDWLAILGWIVGVKQIEFKLNSYCHEFCREVLVLLGLVPPSDEQISATRLENEIRTILNA